MTKEEKILALRARYELLDARGPHNYKICRKILRRIRQVEREE